MVTATFDLAHHRRTERAIVRKLGIDDEQRRDLMARLTGHRSSTELSPDQWRVYVGELQRLEGRPGMRYGKPQLRSARTRAGRSSRGTRHDDPSPLDNAATAEQLEYLDSLRTQIVWTHEEGAEAGFRHWAAKYGFGPREGVARHAWIYNQASLASLSRERVHAIIVGLHRLIASPAAGRKAAANPAAVEEAG